MGVAVYLPLSVLTDSFFHTRLETIVVGLVMIPFGLAVYLGALKLLKAMTEGDFEFFEHLAPKQLRPLVVAMKKAMLH